MVKVKRQGENTLTIYLNGTEYLKFISDDNTVVVKDECMEYRIDNDTALIIFQIIEDLCQPQFVDLAELDDFGVMIIRKALAKKK